MAYAAELELEVDRLRRRDQFLHHEVHEHVKQTMHLCQDGGYPQDPRSPLAMIADQCAKRKELLRDVNEVPGYHASFDQCIAIAVKPLAEQVFRWQQRLSGLSNAVLRLDLQSDHVVWFPARLRHILDNLMSQCFAIR